MTAFLQQTHNCRTAIPRIGTVEDRPCATRPRPLQDSIHVGGQCHENTVLTQQCHVLRILDRTASRRNDEICTLCRRTYGFLLTCAEIWLSMLRKHRRDGHSAAFLDLLVEIVKGAAETRGKKASDTRLPRAHKADQYDIFHARLHTLSRRAR